MRKIFILTSIAVSALIILLAYFWIDAIWLFLVATPFIYMGISDMMQKRQSIKRNFPVEKALPLRDLPKLTFDALPALMMPVILLYGIYGAGATTPTEAAAIAALYSLLVAVFLYRALSFTMIQPHQDTMKPQQN